VEGRIEDQSDVKHLAGARRARVSREDIVVERAVRTQGGRTAQPW